MINYIVSIENTNGHLIDLRLVIDRPLKKGQEFWLPDWIPGSYMIRDFARNIVMLSGKQNDLSAFGIDFSESKTVKISNDDKVMRISVEGNQIFEGPYNETMGRLVGVRFRFFGLGVVESFAIFQEGRLVISSGERTDVASN